MKIGVGTHILTSLRIVSFVIKLPSTQLRQKLIKVDVTTTWFGQLREFKAMSTVKVNDNVKTSREDPSLTARRESSWLIMIFKT
jgi:hypothetical protein